MSFLVAFSNGCLSLSNFNLTSPHLIFLAIVTLLSLWCQVIVTLVLQFSLLLKTLVIIVLYFHLWTLYHHRIILIVLYYYLYLYLFSLNWLLGSDISCYGLFCLTYCNLLFVILRYALVLNDYLRCNYSISFEFYIKKSICLVFHNSNQLN